MTLAPSFPLMSSVLAKAPLRNRFFCCQETHDHRFCQDDSRIEEESLQNRWINGKLNSHGEKTFQCLCAE